MATWRAFVEDAWMADGIKVGLMRDSGSGVRHYLMFGETIVQTVTNPEAALTEEYRPLSLPEDAARALLDALLAKFRMTRADENLRVDYLAERARVDKLLDSLLTPVAIPSVRAV